jgi:hypothetical protein
MQSDSGCRFALITGAFAVIAALVGAAYTVHHYDVLPHLPVIGGYFAPSPVAGETVYRADWLNGTDGWSGYAQAAMFVYGDELHYGDTNGLSWIMPPYRPTDHRLKDYIVESEVRIASGHFFGFKVRWGDHGAYLIQIYHGTDGWVASLYSFPPITHDPHLISSARFVPGDDGDNDVDDGDAIYQIQVVGGTVALLVDGHQCIQITDYEYDEGNVTVWAYKSSIVLENFSIVTAS